MKVEIFANTDLGEIQDNINSWLKEQDGIAVRNILQAEFYEGTLVISIFYEKVVHDRIRHRDNDVT